MSVVPKIDEGITPAFSDAFDSADRSLKGDKESLMEVPDCSFVPHLKSLVFNRNQRLYSHFNDMKSNKLKKLRLEHSNSDDDNKHIVVTFPEDLELSSVERIVLANGLTFIPNPKTIDAYVVNDRVDKFFRGANVHVAIDDFISRCKVEIDNIEVKKPKTLNVSNEECVALRAPRNRDDIVIKKADKRGSIVVWRKDLYIEEANRQLSDSTFYKKVEEDSTLINNDIVARVIDDEIANHRLPRSAVSLIEKNPRGSVFYLLPKKHKVNIPGRPAVSACSCPTHIISAFVDDILQPIVQNFPSYMKDMNQMLRITKDFTFPGDGSPQLFTMDVKSLYTVIPNHDGLRALKHLLDRRADQDHPTSTILRLAELVLTLNHFEFNEDFYQQVCGVAMDTRMGPSYAFFFMGYIEHSFHNQYNGPQPLLYCRYIDDIFGATIMSEETLLNYINCFNDFNEAIKFIFEISDKVNFLGVTFSINSSSITSTVYYKPTDSHSYLRYDSHHPVACKNVVPFSQFLRLRRICTDDRDFFYQLNIMEQFFLSRGYRNHATKQAKERVIKISCSVALKEKDHCDSETKLPLVIPFHDVGNKLSRVNHKNAKILAKDKEIGCLFTNNILTTYCNTKNLKDRLVHSKLSLVGNQNVECAHLF